MGKWLHTLPSHPALGEPRGLLKEERLPKTKTKTNKKKKKKKKKSCIAEAEETTVTLLTSK